jgi:hypothetical protein
MCCADLAVYAPDAQYDCVVCIGLLMFLPCNTAREFADAFAGWRIPDDRIEDFPAPGGTLKRLRTVIAERPAQPNPPRPQDSQ